MLDVMSGGRLEVALPLGTGMEYWVNPINPATARARFRESIDILLKAWREDGPLAYEGDFYTYRYLNVWPRPYQKPHPKMYLVGTGSPETVQLAAELGLGYSSVFVPISKQMQAFAELRERSPSYGHTFTRDKAIIGIMAYVAETKEKAEQEWMEHLFFFFKDALRTTPRYLVPPGYVTPAEFRKRISGPNLHGELTWEALAEQFFVVCGTSDMVAESIQAWAEQAQACALVFPQIEARAAHALERLAPPEALRLILPHAIEQWDKPMIAGHLALLNQLVQAVPAYRLRLAPDTDSLPGVLAGALNR